MNSIIQLRKWLNKQPKKRYIFYIGTAYTLIAIPAGIKGSDSSVSHGLLGLRH